MSEGWLFPSHRERSRSHYFREGRSLCGRWEIGGAFVEPIVTSPRCWGCVMKRLAAPAKGEEGGR